MDNPTKLTQKAKKKKNASGTAWLEGTVDFPLGPVLLRASEQAFETRRALPGFAWIDLSL